MTCPACGGRNVRKATVFWQCWTCRHEWLPEAMTIPVTVPTALVAIQEPIIGRCRQPTFCVACEYLIAEGEWLTYRDGGATHVGACGPPEADPTPEAAPDAYEAVEGRVALLQALSALSARDQIVIAARYGLDGREPRTLEAIAAHLGVTRERVRQLQQGAEARLRPLLEGDSYAPEPSPRPPPLPSVTLDLEALVPDWLAA